jgi:archaellum component FlaG (FlaF/FlaG flagellin family)
MLPNGGNGPITFHVYAYDVNNNVAPLGSRTVFGTNQSSVQPFGTIDTPGQGATVSGIVTVFGWALTPGPNIIATDGSTIQVVVDGVVVGQPTYNQCRGTNGTNFPAPGTCNDDIATAFGLSYRNIAEGSGAIGSFDLDTTTLTNGIHSIEWRVTDSAGHVQGIGSRYFYVQNGS